MTSNLIPVADEVTFGAFELAKLIGVHKTTPGTWIKEGRVKAMKAPSGHWRITRSSVIEYLTFTGRDIPAAIREPHTATKVVARKRNENRIDKADRAYRELVRSLEKGCNRTPKRRAVTMLEINLWQGLSVLSHVERVGYLQAVADAIADYERIERERRSA